MNNIKKCILTASVLMGMCISVFDINNIKVKDRAEHDVLLSSIQDVETIDAEKIEAPIAELKAVPLSYTTEDAAVSAGNEDAEIKEEVEDNSAAVNETIYESEYESETEKQEDDEYAAENLNTETSNNDGFSREIKVELTAYCDSVECSGQWGSQTAMGTTTQVGVIAAPKEIALGSQMYIPQLSYYKEDGIFNVEDRGSAIKVKEDGTYIIDVWFPTYEEAKAFGRQTTTAYLQVES